MKSWGKIVVLVVLGMGTVSSGTLQPLYGLRLPLDYFPDGMLKHELLAKTARAGEDGTIDASEIEFRVFSATGQQEVTIRAVQATINREGLRGHSKHPVSLKRENLLLTGEGFEWNGAAETIRILRRVRLTFPSAMFRERIGDSREVQHQE